MSVSSSLAKTFAAATEEPRIYERWRQGGVFSCAATRDVADDASTRGEEADGGRPYTIMLPPPNITGSLHIGHALNHTLQDILCRFARLRGRDVLWQPGTDHAGIATQMVVERQLESENKSRAELGRAAFIEAIWSWRAISGDRIFEQMQRLGLSCDFERACFTMDSSRSSAVLEAFVRLYRDGLIYRDKRLVNWDPVYQTAISDLETIAVEIDGTLWSIRYPLEGEADRFITIATTRPETILGDSGIAVHPDDPRYRDLIGRHAILPLIGRRLPIIADDYADPETGTGAVKITPAHDFNDFEVGRRHKLAMIDILDDKACIGAEAPLEWHGLDRYEARQRILAMLEAEGLLCAAVPHRHSVPHGDRSNVAIEPRLTDQWYVEMGGLARGARDVVARGEVRFYPDRWKKGFFTWMDNIQPWCISRQIWWGHRVPAWYGSDGAIFVAYDEAEAQAQARVHYGREVVLRRDDDVLDTWFSSALWPFSTLGWPDQTPVLARHYPNDALVSGFDILFFWIARMLMMGIYFMGEPPFKSIYVHALVRDGEGQKMSKSKNNVIDPIDLVDNYGADALRFTLAAMAVQGRDLKLSESRVEGYRNFCTKLWNAVRFALMRGCRRDLVAVDFSPFRAKHPAHRWIAAQLAVTEGGMVTAMEGYRFNELAHTAYHFTWHSFCDWYIEFAKRILVDADPIAERETIATLSWVVERLLIMLHPLAPFTTEALWESFAGDGTDRASTLVAQQDWPQFDDRGDDSDDSAVAAMDWVIACIMAIRSLRALLDIAATKPLGIVLPLSGIATNEAACDLLERVGSVRIAPRCADKPAIMVTIEGEAVDIILGEDVDVGAQRERIAGEAAATRKAHEQIQRRLSDENFLRRAPAEVIAIHRQRLVESETLLQRLEDLQEQLRPRG